MLFYIIIAFIIDIVLFLYVKKKMLKKKLLTNLVTPSYNNTTGISLPIEQTAPVYDTNRVQSTPNNSNFNNENKQKKILLLKKRLTKMIILNGFNFLIFITKIVTSKSRPPKFLSICIIY